MSFEGASVNDVWMINWQPWDNTTLAFSFHVGLVPQNRIFRTIEVGFYWQVAFLSTNQQHQSTEGNLDFPLHWL